MSDHVANTVVVVADEKSGDDFTTHFEEVWFIRKDNHVWARGKHFVTSQNPDTVTEGDAFLHDHADPPQVWFVEEINEDDGTVILDVGERSHVDVLTGDYLPSMGDTCPPTYLEEEPLK